MAVSYSDFILGKSQMGQDTGFDPVFTIDKFFGFQSSLCEWAIRKGRAALFADCGLGKTPMQLCWAENVLRKTGNKVLVLTPLAVSWQTVEEAEKFGIEAVYSKDGKAKAGITVTNYDRLHLFDPCDYSGVVCDESSILKSFNGATRSMVTEFTRKTPYRLLCTATAAPNDYTEVGTSSEALGHLGHMDMLNRFFKNDQNTSDTKGHWKGHGRPRAFVGPQWRFKGHAEEWFWKWVCSWARAVRKPSDLGFSDEGFVLPELVESMHIVEAKSTRPWSLFNDLPVIGLDEEREEQRRTVPERCDKVAELVSHDKSAVCWCHLNEEGDYLTRAIPGAVQVKGSTSIDAREEAFHAFSKGQVRVLVTKPKIGAWGLNWQHCAHTTFFPSHSYEQYYQAVRRFWRFGQKSPVTVDVVTTQGGSRALENLQRKTRQASAMFDRLIRHMNESINIDRSTLHGTEVEPPSWL